MKRFFFLLKCYRNKGVLRNFGCFIGCVCIYVQSYFFLQVCILFRQIEFSFFICSKIIFCMLFGRCICGVLLIYFGVFYFNQYYIKFNICFEMCIRFKVLFGDGSGGVCCKNIYYFSRYFISNYFLFLVELGELLILVYC